ncbi:MAG: zinc-binding alcohol dehydrogenase [Ktedonobacterales bacterium]|nr:zinc-binding alcohol dehydrogenase [Ktedonobacterales bacterium]
MRRSSLLLLAPRQVAWIQEELPPLQPHEILLETRAGAISVGSELPLFRGDARASGPPRYPRMTGYENVGKVLACGAAVRRHVPGDRVVACYGHRTHAIVPETKAFPVPEGVSDTVALLAILTCDAAKGVFKVAPSPYEPVLISGAGAMGLLTLFVLRALGIHTIDVAEPRAERRAQARALGARLVASPERWVEREAAYAVAFEYASREASFQFAQTHMRHGGRICVTADGNLEPLTLAPAFHEKELRIIATSDGDNYARHAMWYFAVVPPYQPRLEALFEAEVAAEDLPALFARLAAGTLTPIKVVVRYESRLPAATS